MKSYDCNSYSGKEHNSSPDDSEELLKRELILKGVVIENTMLLESDINTEWYGVMLITLTKAIHYNEVVRVLQQLFSTEVPTIYALPIVNSNIQ